MYDGVFEGKLVAAQKEQKKKVLILGESHYAKDPDWWKKTGRTTTCVVNDYLEQYSNPDGREKCYRFFDRIVSSFGYDCETQREYFWNTVYFGNYVKVLCGVGDNKAKTAIKEKSDIYNKQLFEFINNNKIDVVFCFSRRVWEALPKYIGGDERTHREDTGKAGSQNDYIKTCVYVPGERNDAPKLKKKLKVYCMRHPSAKGGFNPENYQAILHNAIEETRK